MIGDHRIYLYLTVSLVCHGIFSSAFKPSPVVITTWNLPESCKIALDILKSRGSAVDAVVEGCSYCEREQCRKTVGFGGSPDEGGETTLDALVMDGTTMDVGAVGGLREIKEAIEVAKYVLRFTDHSLLVGELATQFAVSMGFQKTSLTTNYSNQMWQDWKNNNCQPNFWKNVKPDPDKYCGPYKPLKRSSDQRRVSEAKCERTNGLEGEPEEHDTIGMVALDSSGDVAAGVSTNGLKFKIPGRVGDTPVPGSGGYADSEVGGAAATGIGDVLMRFMPSFHAVQLMESGWSPSQATDFVVRRIVKFYPDSYGAVVALNVKGEFGAACFGMKFFPFVAANGSFEQATAFNVTCV